MQTVIRPAYFLGVVALALGIAIGAAFAFVALPSYGAQDVDRSTNIEHHYKDFTFFSATTTTATSTLDSTEDPNGVGMDIRGAKKVVFYFYRDAGAGGNAGSSKFEVEVSPDGGTNWYNFNRLLLMDSGRTATGTVWITAATTTVVAAMDIVESAFDRVRCQVVEVTDGSHTCSAWVEF